MNEEWKAKFYDAIGPLNWGFQLGDDGGLLVLALDEADSLLRELPRLQDRGEEGLVELLRALDEDVLADRVERVYELASRSDYDGGIDEEDAGELSDLASEVAGELEALMRRSRKRRPARAKRARIGSADEHAKLRAATPRSKTPGKKAKKKEARKKPRGKE
ncbi:MAG: hypothetical protein IT378_27435 [Sandaracinaceae bacterium]|nr:hypothetical protein [Sandaracinaceae bacterium]